MMSVTAIHAAIGEAAWECTIQGDGEHVEDRHGRRYETAVELLNYLRTVFVVASTTPLDEPT